ncbi:MAG: RHS repeat-associated protein [Saprospiraceae bacterium]
MSNHLGNVLVTVTDLKVGIDNGGNWTAEYYEATVVSAVDYYPFGSAMAGRKYNDDSYRYGFNGQEEDPEWKGGAVVFKYRIHDTRVGRFLSVDPLSSEYPWNSAYAFAENRVIDAIDLEGAEIFFPLTPFTTSPILGTSGTNLAAATRMVRVAAETGGRAPQSGPRPV